MTHLREKLSKIITSKPDVIQFAKDRKYEESWIISINQHKPTEREINKYLIKDKFGLIIVEYIWNSLDDDNRFVLTLFLDKKCRLQNSTKFITVALDIFYNYMNFDSFLEKINHQIIGDRYLLENKTDSINLSVFNHWLSVGPVELWKKGEVYDIEKIKLKIYSRPDIAKTSLNYQGLLFKFNSSGNLNGPFYGFKTPCCNKVRKEWVVDLDKINKWIKIMLGL